MYDRVVVPVPHGARIDALFSVRPLARALRSPVLLLHLHHAVEAPAEQEGLPQFRYQNVLERWDARDAEAEAEEAEWLAELADEFRALEPDLEVASRVVHAPLARCMRHEDERVLVVIPAPAGRPGLDATGQEILRACHVPVLVLPADAAAAPVRRILVTLDGSRFSEDILSPALELARALGAGVTLVEVVTRLTGIARLLHPAERTVEAAQRALQDVADRLPPEVGPVDVRVVEDGTAAAGVLSEAGRAEVGMVAMATHGRGGLRRFLLGSVAEAVLGSSPVPVLLYRPAGAGVGVDGPATRMEEVEA
jgi:nucleotide-binding universal stress UspA family protein